MSKYTLILLDTTGIQDYIFASNRLQENIGASELVYRATSFWAFDALSKAGITHNIEVLRDPENPKVEVAWEFKPDVTIDTAKAEVIQAAGGNTLIIFREKAKAIEFVQKLTLHLLKEAPGLTVLAQHIDFDFASEKLTEVRKTLEGKMREYKQERQVSAPFLGLGVTAMCDSTGLAAVRTPNGKQTLADRDFDLLVPGQDEQEAERSRLISRETTFKLAARDLARERLENTIGKTTITKNGKIYEFPSDIDHLGRVLGEESYVAVIHADGNRMGGHVRQVIASVEKQFAGSNVAEVNRGYIKAMRSFSKSLESANREALKEVVKMIMDAIDMDDKVAGKIPIVKVKKHNYIPFRPLVFGGDDVTFLCNGQLGVELAARYLDAFERHTKAKDLRDFYASAGVSIVKMHYPFSRAYKLSEELAGSAKSLTRDPKPDCSALDWHFAQSGLSGSLNEIRKREYSVPETAVQDILDGNDKTNVLDENKKFTLTLRPVLLEASGNERNWRVISWLMKTFQEEKPWADSHNKVLGLREELRKGVRAVEHYLLNFGFDKLPTVAPGSEKNGWYKFEACNMETSKENRKVVCRCIYFDAIELLDHHISLK